MSIVFTPLWKTPEGSLGAFQEDDTIEIRLRTDYISYYPVTIGDTILSIGPMAGYVSDVRDGPDVVATLLDGENLVIAPRSRPGLLTLIIPGGGHFTLLNGELPAGLTLGNDGAITGTIGDSPNTLTTYSFTVRCASPIEVRDRPFSLDITGIERPGMFISQSLPDAIADEVLRRAYRPLGALNLAQPYTYTFSIDDQDNVLPPIRLRPVTGLPARPGLFGSLPKGLSLSDQSITGIVAPDAIPGRYLFIIALDDPDEPQEEIFELVVVPSVGDAVVVIPKIVWMTPAGHLGTLDEQDASYLSIDVYAEGREKPLLALSPHSRPLPAGLTLDPVTGRILGRLGHVTGGSYAFTVRATSSPMYLDRDFSIDVVSRFRTAATIDVNLRLRSTERLIMASAYRDRMPASVLFRPDDPRFGLLRDPLIYMIAGLDGARLAQEEPIALSSSAYHGTFPLVLGAHRVATARDPSGTAVYEVLYRDLYDPHALVGGFSFDQVVPLRDDFRDPQRPTLSLFPQSVRNLRLDLIDRIGLASLDPSLSRTPGLDGSEALPLFMRSPQTPDDPASRLGFIPAIVLGYLKVGSATGLLRLLKRYENDFPPNGTVYEVDKLWLSNDRLLQLEWDANIAVQK